jgi:hypothetical protein
MKPKSSKGEDAVAAARKRSPAKKKALLKGADYIINESRKAPDSVPAAFATLRASMLAHEYRDPAAQKNKLVADILGIFDNPVDWPMTDGDRIGLLKHLYRQARKIRDTENAIKAAS